MNRHAVSAHIESEDVEAVKVRRTGDSAMRARKTKIDDFKALAPVIDHVTIRIKLRATTERTLFHINCNGEQVALQELPYEEACDEHGHGDPDENARVPTLIIEMDESCQEDEDRRKVLCDSAGRQDKRPVCIGTKIS